MSTIFIYTVLILPIINMKKNLTLSLLLLSFSCVAFAQPCTLDLLKSNDERCDESKATSADKTAYVDYRIKNFAGLNVIEARHFFESLKKASADNDKNFLGKIIRYPITFYNHAKLKKVTNHIEFYNAYPSIFNEKVRDAIAKQKYEDLVVNGQGIMVGAGEVWISGIVVGKSSRKINIKIITINN